MQRQQHALPEKDRYKRKPAYDIECYVAERGSALLYVSPDTALASTEKAAERKNWPKSLGIVRRKRPIQRGAVHDTDGRTREL